MITDKLVDSIRQIKQDYREDLLLDAINGIKAEKREEFRELKRRELEKAFQFNREDTTFWPDENPYSGDFDVYLEAYRYAKSGAPIQTFLASFFRAQKELSRREQIRITTGYALGELYCEIGTISDNQDPTFFSSPDVWIDFRDILVEHGLYNPANQSFVGKAALLTRILREIEPLINHPAGPTFRQFGSLLRVSGGPRQFTATERLTAKDKEKYPGLKEALEGLMDKHDAGLTPSLNRKKKGVRPT